MLQVHTQLSPGTSARICGAWREEREGEKRGRKGRDGEKREFKNLWEKLPFFFLLQPPVFSGSPPETGLSSSEKLKFVGLLRWEMVASGSAQKPGQKHVC